MDFKRTLVAMVLSVAILVGWQYFFPPAPKPQIQAPVASAEKSVPAPAAPVTAVPGALGLASAPAPAVVAKESVLSNELVHIRLSSRGARVEDVTLQKYNDALGPNAKPLVLLGGEEGAAGMTGLESADPRGEAIYSVVEEAPNRVVYAWQSPAGLRIEKTYALEPGHYDSRLSIRIVNAGAAPVRDRLSLRLVQDLRKNASSYVFEGPAYLKDGGLQEVKVKNLKDNVSASGNIAWAGVVEKYFMTAFVPDDASKTDVSVSEDMSVAGVARVTIAEAPFDLPPGGEVRYGARFYSGPKQKEILESIGVGLEKAIDFGWFSIIATPLQYLLIQLYGVFGNYGVAILILTAFIKLLFWPLSAKSFKSMARMKELQPKVQKLKDRYGDDRERLNVEMMQLWKTHKVNPFSGCLPMLVQIPVFIALYNVLMGSIQIRHAPFIFWLHDLSSPDPYYVTPVLMGLSMYLQQKLTPSTGAAEMQMKFMLYGMPILFTWLFKDFASGLVIYWLANNILSIAQQWAMLRSSAKAAVAKE
jgi:YidC/Oxa1 family membrane protein insertase